MFVIGIDPSAKCIAVVGVETFTNSIYVEKGKLYPKGATRQTPESLSNAFAFTESVIMSVEHLAPAGQRYAFIETPLVGRGGVSATIKQAYVGGIIRGCLATRGFEVVDVHPSTWRAGLKIKGKGTDILKIVTRQYVETNLSKAMPRIGDDHDLVDAAAICLFGLQQLASDAGPPKSPPRRVQRRTTKPILRKSQL